MPDARPKTFVPGAALVWARQRILWLLYVISFVLAYVATRGTNERVGAILDHSKAASQLTHGFNVGALSSLVMSPEAPLGGLASSSVSSAVLFTIFMIFATGGILMSYYSGQRLRAGAFFEWSGHHFWRFVRLTIYLFLVLIPVLILGGILGRVYTRIDKQSISPMPAVHFFEATVVMILFLLICIRIWFDMAQIIAVADDERRMHRCLRRAAALLWHNFGSLFWLYFRASVIAWVVFAVGIHTWTDHLRPESTFAPFLLSQLLIIFWIGCRLWQRASECIWYREHQHTVSVDVPVSDTPLPSNVPVVSSTL